MIRPVDSLSARAPKGAAANLGSAATGDPRCACFAGETTHGFFPLDERGTAKTGGFRKPQRGIAASLVSSAIVNVAARRHQRTGGATSSRFDGMKTSRRPGASRGEKNSHKSLCSDAEAIYFPALFLLPGVANDLAKLQLALQANTLKLSFRSLIQGRCI